MFVHFERWTLPVLTTWMYAWQDKTVIDAHDKLLKSFSNTSTFRNQYIYIYIYIQDCVDICHLSHGRISVHFCTMQWWNMEAGHTSLTKVSFSESFCFFVIFFLVFFFCFCFWFKLQECLHTQETVLYQVDKYYRTSALPYNSSLKLHVLHSH